MGMIFFVVEKKAESLIIFFPTLSLLGGSYLCIRCVDMWQIVVILSIVVKKKWPYSILEEIFGFSDFFFFLYQTICIYEFRLVLC